MSDDDKIPRIGMDSVILCGVPPKVPHPTEFSKDGKTCPKCGAKDTEHGFGLMGGGYGPYEFCCADGCDWFAKRECED